jgi:hypothetical protein
MKIIETDNFGGDYPNEKFVNLPNLSAERARVICKEINASFGDNFPRYWRVVENDYTLQPGFEP